MFMSPRATIQKTTADIPKLDKFAETGAKLNILRNSDLSLRWLPSGIGCRRLLHHLTPPAIFSDRGRAVDIACREHLTPLT